MSDQSQLFTNHWECDGITIYSQVLPNDRIKVFIYAQRSDNATCYYELAICFFKSPQEAADYVRLLVPIAQRLAVMKSGSWGFHYHCSFAPNGNTDKGIDFRNQTHVKKRYRKIKNKRLLKKLTAKPINATEAIGSYQEKALSVLAGALTDDSKEASHADVALTSLMAANPDVPMEQLVKDIVDAASRQSATSTRAA